MKVRQITGGFLYADSEENAVEFEENPKINELQEILEDIGPNKKVIIFCQYKWEIRKIGTLFPESQRSLLYSGTADKDAAIQFFRSPECRILIAHPASAGVGLSFNDCDYMIFYSLSYSFMEHYQARGRIMRANKKNNATYIYIIAQKSIDEVILAALLKKEGNHELFQRIMK